MCKFRCFGPDVVLFVSLFCFFCRSQFSHSALWLNLSRLLIIYWQKVPQAVSWLKFWPEMYEAWQLAVQPCVHFVIMTGNKNTKIKALFFWHFQKSHKTIRSDNLVQVSWILVVKLLWEPCFSLKRVSTQLFWCFYFGSCITLDC